jgi:hypothetical protein
MRAAIINAILTIKNKSFRSFKQCCTDFLKIIKSIVNVTKGIQIKKMFEKRLTYVTYFTYA